MSEKNRPIQIQINIFGDKQTVSTLKIIWKEKQNKAIMS
jgi:hypothetical protein